MSMKLVKRKLKRRGEELYNKYFFNPEHVINEIINHHDESLPVNENHCDVIFNTNQTSIEQIYELIMYFPNKLKEKKFIDDDFVCYIYNEFGETINIMRKYIGFNVRGRLSAGAKHRAKVYNLNENICSEDIKLTELCPLLNKSIEYGNTKATNYSASLDRIDPNKGYIIGNIQVISLLANQMKSSANKEELLTFANNILEYIVKI